MLKINKIVIGDKCLLTIISTLFDNYINNINHCNSKFIDNNVIYDNLLINTIYMIQDYKKLFTEKLISIVCANDSITAMSIYKTFRSDKQSINRSKQNIDKEKEELNKIREMHNKIINIQLIFVLLYDNINKLTSDIKNELLIYCKILYIILDNINTLILKLIKSITTFDSDINKYLYTISITTFLKELKENVPIINSYIIEADENTESPSIYSLPILNMYSKKLPFFPREVNIYNINSDNFEEKLRELKSSVSNFASVNEISDFRKNTELEITKRVIREYSKDCMNEYELIFKDIDKYEDLDHEIYDSMLKHR